MNPKVKTKARNPTRTKTNAKSHRFLITISFQGIWKRGMLVFLVLWLKTKSFWYGRYRWMETSNYWWKCRWFFSFFKLVIEILQQIIHFLKGKKRQRKRLFKYVGCSQMKNSLLTVKSVWNLLLKTKKMFLQLCEVGATSALALFGSS